MYSKYFDIKTTNDDSILNRINSLAEEFSGKKILAYGFANDFKRLNKKYKISEKFDFIGLTSQKRKDLKGADIRIISIKDIKDEQYDYILVVAESAIRATHYLLYDLSVPNEQIKTIFEEKYKDESENINYLYIFNFDKTLPKLINKLKNKKVILYGAGLFLEVINSYFDISELNVIAIADKKFENHDENEQFLQYNVCSPDEIKDLNPDYVIVTTKFYVSIIEDLYYNILKDTKIKIQPLVKKDFFTLLKEV